MKTLKPWKLSCRLAGATLLGALAALPGRAQDFPTKLETLGPINYWRLNETTPSPAINTVSNQGSAGAVGTGYVVDGALTGQPGIVGNSVLLSQGDTGDCITRVDIPNNRAFNPDPPFSIEFWANPTSISTDSTGLAVLSSMSPFPGGGSRSGYLFYLKQGASAGTAIYTMRVGGEDSYSGTAASATVPSPANSWTHVVGEFDGTTVYIYINGVLSGSGLASVSQPFHYNQWVSTRLGGTSLNGNEYDQYGAGNRGYNGYVDEFAIYNTLLSSNVVMAHYMAGTNNPTPATYDALVLQSSPTGYWNLDEPLYTAPSVSNTFAADLGFLDDLGTNTLGALGDQPGVPGLSSDAKSVYYNGTIGSLVLDTNVPPTSFNNGEQMTLAAWIKPFTYGGDMAQDIIVQGYDETTYQENYLRISDTYDWEGNGDPDVAYYDVGSAQSSYVSAIYPAPPGDIGNWVFLVGTYDGTQWNLYRNGSLVATAPDGGVGPAPLTLPWSVGSRSSPSPYFGFFFDGSIEEAAIFTNALDAATISNLYNSVTMPPVITEAPTVPSPSYAGSDATLSVWADGPGTLSYQWYTNGSPLIGQTATNLVLTGLNASSDATYSVIVSNPYGSVTSSVVLVVLPLPPLVVAPATETRWVGSPLSFAPSNLDTNEEFSFQWDFNGMPISGATQASYTAPASLGSAGSYTLVISNSGVVLTSSVSTLKVLTPPNYYVSTILGDNPLSYFRLDETNGTIGYDYAGGNNGNYYGSYELDQPGYSLIDPDPAVTFSGTVGSYLGDIGATTIDFSGTNAEFSIEAWANGAAGQASGAAIVAKGTGNNGGINTEQFALAVSTSGPNYTFLVCDNKGDEASVTANTGPDGAWHHLVGVCDEVGGTLTLYIDGAVASTGGFSALKSTGILNSENPVSIGAQRSGVLPPYDYDYAGTIDEVAIYHTNLSPSQVYAHYAARYGTNLAPYISAQPLSTTNYVGYPVSLSVSAGGSVPLTYQWNKVGSGAIPGATAAIYSVATPSASDNGTYTVTVANNVGTTNSLPAVITILPVPTNPPAISDLVMHLTFDNTLEDGTGRGNNATYMTSGTFTTNSNPLTFAPGQIGEAFVYETDVNTNSFANGGLTNAYYASVGVRPDLQFGSSVSFTVSMWVNLPNFYGDEETSYSGDDLPFFTDTIDSTFGAGFVFAPSFGGPTTDWPGGWAYSLGGTGATIGSYGNKNLINDNAWHNLIYVVDRTAAGVVEKKTSKEIS